MCRFHPDPAEAVGCKNLKFPLCLSLSDSPFLFVCKRSFTLTDRHRTQLLLRTIYTAPPCTLRDASDPPTPPHPQSIRPGTQRASRHCTKPLPKTQSRARRPQTSTPTAGLMAPPRGALRHACRPPRRSPTAPVKSCASKVVRLGASCHSLLLHQARAPQLRRLPRRPTCPLSTGEGRGMSSKYEGRDEACPVSTGGRGGGPRRPATRRPGTPATGPPRYPARRGSSRWSAPSLRHPRRRGGAASAQGAQGHDAGRGVSDWYGVRDAACPIGTG